MVELVRCEKGKVVRVVGRGAARRTTSALYDRVEDRPRSRQEQPRDVRCGGG